MTFAWYWLGVYFVGGCIVGWHARAVLRPNGAVLYVRGVLTKNRVTRVEVDHNPPRPGPRRCDSCGKPLSQPEYAARVDSPVTGVTVWCMGCWDAPDEIALSEYRRCGMPQPADTPAETETRP